MAANPVTGDQYRTIDRKLREIKRQLDQDEGYPFSLSKLDDHLQLAVEGKFDARYRRRSLCSLKQAAEILGDDFHPLKAAEKYFDIPLGDNDQMIYETSVCPVEVVYQMKGKAVLTPTLPLHLFGVFEKASGGFHSDHRPNPWFGNNQPFGQACPTPGYMFVGKEVLDGSVGVHWDKQQGMVVPPDFIPSTATVAQAATLHYELTGERLFGQYWARTADASAGGDRVHVHGYPDGFRVRWDAVASSRFGVAWARKFA